MTGKRSFTVQGSESGFEGGRYTGDSPIVAARHAAKQIFRHAESKSKSASQKKIKFILRETTRGSKKTMYHYQASTKRLEKPKVIVRNGVEITVSKVITVKSTTETISISSKKA